MLWVEGLGLFEAEYEDDEPASIGALAAVVYRLPKLRPCARWHKTVLPTR